MTSPTVLDGIPTHDEGHVQRQWLDWTPDTPGATEVRIEVISGHTCSHAPASTITAYVDVLTPETRAELMFTNRADLDALAPLLAPEVYTALTMAWGNAANYLLDTRR